MICNSCFHNWNEIIKIHPHFMNDDGFLIYICDICYSETQNPLSEDDIIYKPEIKKSNHNKVIYNHMICLNYKYLY